MNDKIPPLAIESAVRDMQREIAIKKEAIAAARREERERCINVLSTKLKQTFGETSAHFVEDAFRALDGEK